MTTQENHLNKHGNKLLTYDEENSLINYLTEFCKGRKQLSREDLCEVAGPFIAYERITRLFKIEGLDFPSFTELEQSMEQIQAKAAQIATERFLGVEVEREINKICSKKKLGKTKLDEYIQHDARLKEAWENRSGPKRIQISKKKKGLQKTRTEKLLPEEQFENITEYREYLLNLQEEIMKKLFKIQEELDRIELRIRVIPSPTGYVGGSPSNPSPRWDGFSPLNKS